MLVGAILRDAGTGVEWHLAEGDAWIVGRSESCEVVLADESCGRRHLRIEFAGGGWRAHLLADGGASFSVNGIATEREELRAGDVIRVGRTLLRFSLDERAPAADGKSVSRREAIALPQSFEALITLFTAPSPSVDAALVSARAGEALLRFCEHPDKRARLREAYDASLASSWPVLRAIGAHGIAALSAAGEPGAGNALASLVDHPDGHVRSAAARALSAVDPLSAGPRVHARAAATLDAAEDPAEAAELAAQLAAIDDEALVGDLARRAASKAMDESRAAVRVCAAAVLGEIAGAGAAEWVRPLRALLGDAAEEVRAAAVDALRRACHPGSDEARDALRGAIADRSPRVFQAATRALAGTHDPLLAELLVKALRATDPADLERRARYRRALEDVTGERRGPDPDAWLH